MHIGAKIWFGVCACVAGGALVHGILVQFTTKRSVPTMQRAHFSTQDSYTFQSITQTRDSLVGLTTQPAQLIVFAPPTTHDAPMQIRKVIRVPDTTNARIQSSPAHSFVAIGTTTSTQLIDVENKSTWTFPVDQNITVLNPASGELISLDTQKNLLRLTRYAPDLPVKQITLPIKNYHNEQLPAIAWSGDGTHIYIADDEPGEEHEHEGAIVNTSFFQIPLETQGQITTSSFTSFRVTDQPGIPNGYHLLLRAHNASTSPESFDPNGDGVVGTFLFAISQDTSSSTAVLMDPEFTAQSDMVHCMWTTTDALACVAQQTKQNGRSFFISRSISAQGTTQRISPLPNGFVVEQAVQGAHPELFALLEATTRRLYLIRMSETP